MKKVIFVVVCAAFLLTMPMSFASQVSYNDMTILLEDDLAKINVSILYSEFTTNKVYYAAYSKIRNLHVEDSSGELSCQTDSKPYGVEIACTPREERTENYSVKLSYDAPGLVSQSADAKVFIYTHSVREPTKNMNVLLVLPEGYGILDESEFEAYYPETGVVGGTGRRATITWNIKSPPLGKAMSFTAYYEQINRGGEMFIPLLAVFFGIFTVSVFFIYRRKSSPGKTEMVLSVLRDEEKHVLEAIQQKGENCRQRDIVRITDFSKARVSRLLDDLEKRGIIGRMRVGRTNKVYIKDTILKMPVRKKEEESEKKTIPFS